MYVADSIDVTHVPGFVMADPRIQTVSVVRRIAASNGTVTTIVGQANSPSPSEGPAPQAYLGLLSGLAPNGDGSVAFSSNNTVGEIETQSTVRLLAGRNVQLPPDGTQAAGDSWLSLPVSVQMAASRSGNFYYADHCMIRKVGADGTLQTAAGTGKCSSTVPKAFGPGVDLPPIQALAVDSHDHVFAAFGTNLYSLRSDGFISAIAGVQNRAQALAFDSQDRLYVVGAFAVSRVNPDGSVELLSWNPVALGAGYWFPAPGVAIDGSDNVYLMNYYQYNSNFTHLVYRFTPDGTASTVAVFDFPDYDFAVDSQGAVWYVSFFDLIHVQPEPSGVDVPTRMSGRCCGYSGDGGALVAATFSLAQSAGIVNTSSGDLYLLDDGNAVIRKISGNPPSKAPTISAPGIVNAASLVGGAIAPGELISIFGTNFGGFGLQTTSPVNNSLPTTLGSLRVIFNPAGLGTIVAATPTQVNVFVPYNVGTYPTIDITVAVDDVSSAVVTMPVASTLFGLSTDDASGTGQGAILNQDGSYNSDKNPAPAGTIVSLFGTGEGATTPALPDGALVISTPYSLPNQKVTVTIGDQPAEVTYAGAAPFLPTGVLQINARIPAGVTGDAAIVVSVGGISTSRKVTVAVK